MTKTKSSPSNNSNNSNNGAPGANATQEAPAYRNNPEVDAKIDKYIQDNPKYWNYVQAMPRERLERSVVLNEIRDLERQQRIRGNLMDRINANPKLKQAYETLVNEVPEEQRETVMGKIAQETSRAVARTKNPRQSTRETVGV